MNMIYKQRQAGKTTELVKIADNYNGYIVCHSVASVEHVMLQARTLGCRINLPITHRDFLQKNYDRCGVKCFHIDDVDCLLTYMTDVPIDTITMSVPLSEKKPEVYVPFTIGDDILGKVVSSADVKFVVIAQDNEGVAVSNAYITYKNLLDKYAIDGKPAGKLKE